MNHILVIPFSQSYGPKAICPLQAAIPFSSKSNGKILFVTKLLVRTRLELHLDYNRITLPAIIIHTSSNSTTEREMSNALHIMDETAHEAKPKVIIAKAAITAVV